MRIILADDHAILRESLKELLQEEGVKLIDCQVHTPHLESLGARMIPRAQFIAMLHDLIR